MHSLRDHHNGSQGMTLVELMVALAVTAIIMGLSLSIFFGQYKSYGNRKDASETQETGPTALDLIKRNLMEGGWSAKPEMAFYFEDGGANGTDKIFVNDTRMIDIETPEGREMLMADSCSGCQGISVTDTGTKNITVATLDIDDDGEADFKAANYQFVISDASTNKVARILTIDGNALNLETVLNGEFLAPVVYYECVLESGLWSLRRSDRTTGGRQPLADNIVDLQVAYRDEDGAWYGDEDDAACASGTSCMSPFEAEKINLVRITMVTRGRNRDMTRVNDSNYCRPAVENRDGAVLGSDECGYVYNTYVAYVRPRNLGMD